MLLDNGLVKILHCVLARVDRTGFSWVVEVSWIWERNIANVDFICIFLAILPLLFVLLGMMLSDTNFDWIELEMRACLEEVVAAFLFVGKVSAPRIFWTRLLFSPSGSRLFLFLSLFVVSITGLIIRL